MFSDVYTVHALSREFSESCQELDLKQQQANMLGSFYKNF